MEKSGTPPTPKRAVKADIIVTTGNARPMPVKAIPDAPGICPIKIRSIMLYRT